MDNLTHSLVGALIGQAGLKRKTGLAMPALIIGANAPDIDAACFLWLDGVQHLGFRRGITHGPIAWVVLPLLLAGGLWWFDRWQAKRGKRPEGGLPVRFRWLYGLAFLATLTHPALDWLNVYGVRLLEPFSSRWFYGDTLFIIDVWLWALMGFATWFSLRREKRGREWQWPARIALVVALAYIGLNGWISWSASQSYPRLQHFRREAIASPLPIEFWRREIISFDRDAHLSGRVRQSFWSLSDGLGPEAALIGQSALVDIGCVTLPDIIRERSPEVRAFVFWSRIPVVDTDDEGNVLLRDARFYDPRARDRFTVALPDVRCEPLNSP